MPRPVPIVRGLFIAVVLLGLTGCFGSSPSVVKATMNADAQLNPDTAGRPSPVVVRLFELKSSTAFDSADFFSIYQREQATLGPDLVAREELTLLPGQTLKFERTLQEGTAHIGLVAAFRDIEHARWRAGTAVRRNKKTKITVRLEASSISISAK
jgi:type VI secretion system protein VasD